jgi:hypothetical protein
MRRCGWRTAARAWRHAGAYFTDPDGLAIQLQDVSYCGGGGYLGNTCLS